MDNPSPFANNRSRAARLDRLYRRISQLDDESLASLDDLVATADSIELVDADPPALHTRPSVSRRRFLLGVLVGGAAVAGGGTLLLSAQSATQEAAIPTPTANQPLPTLRGEPVSGPIATPGPAPDEIITTLESRLTNLSAERLALRAELDSARTRQVDLEGQLQAQQNDIAYLQQVVLLYEQMEATDLDTRIAAGISPVAAAMVAIQTGRGLLQAGIQQAAAALSTVEVQSPAIANGLLWLEDQVNLLSTALQNLEDALSDLVEPVAPAAEQIGDFIGQVLDLLPFGVGQNIREGLDAVAAILTHIPELIASINPVIITPLRQWVSPEESDKGLIAEVVRPISENLISPAQNMVENTSALETAFNTGLKTPVEQALADRAVLREQLHRLTGVS
jgi:hypothetical protein